MNPPQPPPYQPYGSNEYPPPPAYQQAPPEYEQPGAPAFAPADPPYQPIYANTPPPGLNGFAVASLIFGICGGLLFSTSSASSPWCRSSAGAGAARAWRSPDSR